MPKTLFFASLEKRFTKNWSLSFMVFSSLIFTFAFLPAVIVLYYLSKEKYRNYILLFFSLFFYAYGEPRFVVVMIFSILANYTLALLLDKNRKYAKLLLTLDILLNLFILYVFKYVGFTNYLLGRFLKINFAFHVFHLPIGISFFTFQALSYVIDVYTKKVNVQKNVLSLALYISFFPQLVAGPIVRYSTIEEQIAHRTFCIERMGEGARRFLLGFCKKIILANNLSVVSDRVFSMGDISSVNPLLLWLSSISFSLQIFYDFSGYSDMAIGLGKLFGFDFEENFNYPYISKSITEFWRRWHISLGHWFRDYVYIPLGGSRCGTFRTILNLFAVWLLTGLWHGAALNFIFWGLLYFVLLCIEKFIVKPQKRPKIFKFLWAVLSLFCINFLWVIFNAHSLRSGISYCLGMCGFYKTSWAIDPNLIYFVREYGIFLAFGIVFSTPIAKLCAQKTGERISENVRAVILPLGYCFIFLWAVSFVLVGAHNPFIYFNF